MQINNNHKIIKVYASSVKERSKRFKYTCNRCLHCCNDKIIQLNPYEIARLASEFNITTAEFSKMYTVDGQGTILNQEENGACVFLGTKGCTVHPNRPLVCRLYPLGRYVSPDAVETFSTIDPHPLSKGSYSDSGTIGEYLVSQDADPYMQAADDYYFWFCYVQSVLDDKQENTFSDPENDIFSDNLLDMDSIIGKYCSQNNIDPPTDIEERKHLHIDILYSIASKLEGETT